MRRSNGFCVSMVASHSHRPGWLTLQPGVDAAAQSTVSSDAAAVAGAAVEEAKTSEHQPAALAECRCVDSHLGL